jgi:hypothetical protein
MPVQRAIFSDSMDFSKRLAKAGCGYFLSESGYSGANNIEATDLQVAMVSIVMTQLHMIDTKIKKQQVQIYRKEEDYALKKNGIWQGNFPKDNIVKIGSVLGQVVSYDGVVLETIKANQNGILFWKKEGMRAKAGDIVAGVGYQPLK